MCVALVGISWWKNFDNYQDARYVREKKKILVYFPLATFYYACSD